MEDKEEVLLVLNMVAKGLVDLPDSTSVEMIFKSDKSIIFMITAEKTQISKLIGIGGRTINALKTLTTALCGKLKIRASLIINE